MSINDKAYEMTSRFNLALRESNTRGLRPPRERGVKGSIREGRYNQAYKKCPSPLFVDPLFDDSTNQGPTNYRTGTMGTDGCIELPTGLDNKFTETHNGSMDAIGWHKIWARHAPYAQNDYRLLGDNWNYYIEDPVQIELYDVPWCDPIRTHTPDVPCFEYCVTPLEEPCLDQNCQFGRMTQLDTNKHGKFGLYFDTKSHGGDNFQFRASNVYCYIGSQENCIVSEPPEIFTVWRKIYLDYAFMEDRGDTYPEDDCYGTHDESILKEFRGIHSLDNPDVGQVEDAIDPFQYIKGSFDDAFYELVRPENPPQYYTPYWAYIYTNVGQYYGKLFEYGEYTDFRTNRPLDTNLVFGVDHFDEECYIGAPTASFIGCATYPHWSFAYDPDAVYCFVGVGVTHDALANGKKVITRECPDGETPYWKIIGVTASHEIGHSLMEAAGHGVYTYGLMSWDDQRSYFHAGHVNKLRNGPSKFDDVEF